MRGERTWECGRHKKGRDGGGRQVQKGKQIPSSFSLLFPPILIAARCTSYFLKMVESFHFYYTFVLTTYMALGCLYISWGYTSLPTAITDHNVSLRTFHGVIHDLLTLFCIASSAVLSPPPSSHLTHRLGPWRQLTVQTKPHLIFLCHDFYWHKRELNLKIWACSARTAVIPIIQYGGKRVH